MTALGKTAIEGGRSRGQIGVLFNVWADEENTNAQSLNARDIALRLDPSRFICTFFHRSRPDTRFLGRSNIRLVHLPNHLKSIVVLREYLSRNHDVLFYPTPDLAMALYWRLAPLLRRRKFVVAPVEGSAASLDAAPARAKRRIITNIRSADLAVAITPYIRKSVEEQYGIRLPVVPIGVDTAFFRHIDEPRKHGPVRVLYVGHLLKRKGPHLLIEAAQILRNEPIEFLLVGSLDRDPEYARSLELLIKAQQLTTVRLAGALSREQIRDVMREADVMLLPSRLEGMPKVTLEAAASGLPCIVFSDYETPSVLDGMTGFQVSSVAEMVERIRLLVRDQELRRRMGDAAVEHARQFDWDVLIPRWEALLAGELNAALAAGCTGESPLGGS